MPYSSRKPKPFYPLYKIISMKSILNWLYVISASGLLTLSYFQDSAYETQPKDNLELETEVSAGTNDHNDYKNEKLDTNRLNTIIELIKVKKHKDSLRQDSLENITELHCSSKREISRLNKQIKILHEQPKSYIVSSSMMEESHPTEPRVDTVTIYKYCEFDTVKNEIIHQPNCILDTIK